MSTAQHKQERFVYNNS